MNVARWNNLRCTSTSTVTRPDHRVECVLRALALLCAVLALPGVVRPSTNHLQTALELFNQGDLEGAEKEARFALNAPQDRAPAWGILGTIRVQQKKYDEAAGFLREALRSEEHTSELQSHSDLVCRLLLEKKNQNKNT